MRKIKKIVDLSWEFTAETPIYPGDPEPSVTVATTLENEGYNLSTLVMGTQTGTHVDAPYHFSNSGETIDNMELDFFLGEAVVVRVTDKKADEAITLEDIEPYKEEICEGKIVLFITKKSYSIKEMLEGPLRNKPFLHLTIAFIFAILAQAIFLGVLVYYLRYNLNLNDTQVSLVNIIMWIVALFWVFPIDHWSTKYSKVVSWTISMGIWLLCMIVFPLFFLKPGSTAAPIIMTSILVVGLNALYQVIYAMISDCVEVDELMSGERREGLFYSMATVSQKLAAASGVSVLGMIIDYVGYNPAVSVQSMQTVQGFHNIFVIGTSVCLLLSIVTMATNPLTKKRYSEVLEVVRLKRAGKEIALDEFKDLLFIKKNRK